MTDQVSVARLYPLYNNDALSSRFTKARLHSIHLTSPLSAEDMVVQANEDCSPAKWHLAHTSWFFETFVLRKYVQNYQIFDKSFDYCFNSYYEAIGDRHPRALRGLLTRPTCDHVFAYRNHVDDALLEFILSGIDKCPSAAHIIELGIQHEEQHQELLLTDILALFACNPLRPAYNNHQSSIKNNDDLMLNWSSYEGGLSRVGHSGSSFAWDNESPAHDVFIQPFSIANRLVNNAEWVEFMIDGGYDTATLWLADGWRNLCQHGIKAPLYWQYENDHWHTMTLDGMQSIVPEQPVVHVSYYEADAFARWSGKRMPTEFEWEVAACSVLATPKDMFGKVWQWTQSAYQPYPGYKAPLGALGEYNGKFMINQLVLKGSSLATPKGHARATYRNFFYPHQRWQFTGVRLAQDIA